MKFRIIFQVLVFYIVNFHSRGVCSNLFVINLKIIRITTTYCMPRTVYICNLNARFEYQWYLNNFYYNDLPLHRDQSDPQLLPSSSSSSEQSLPASSLQTTSPVSTCKASLCPPQFTHTSQGMLPTSPSPAPSPTSQSQIWCMARLSTICPWILYSKIF